MLTGKRIRFLIFLASLFSPVFVLDAKTLQQTEGHLLSDYYGTIVKEMSDSTVTYVSKLGEKYIIPRDGVYFNDNECALKCFIYNNICREYECNTREVFVIFFDKDLNIKEVRIADIKGSNEPLKCEHKRDYIKAIMKTHGMWNKRIIDSDKYVYMFSMHVH